MQLLSFRQLKNVMYLARYNTTWEDTDIYFHSCMKYRSSVLAITTLEKNRNDGIKKVFCKKCRMSVSSTVLGANNNERKYLKYIYGVGGI